MKVKDHNKYRLFDYENDLTNKNFQLGEIVIRISGADRTLINQDNGNPIGVVIQLHDDGDCRTDMFGNCSSSEVRLATIDEIKEYRENLINDLEV
jgi:hypothetical protein